MSGANTKVIYLKFIVIIDIQKTLRIVSKFRLKFKSELTHFYFRLKT